MRDNDVTEIPEEIGELEELTVLDVVGNRLPFLPHTITKLKLDALWIDGSQVHTHAPGYPRMAMVHFVSVLSSLSR